MTFDNDLILIGEREQEKDEYGNTIYSDPIKTQILCNESSVGRIEFYSAGEVGLKPEYILTIHDFEYNGEKRAEYKNQTLEILRTYRPKDGLLELTVGVKIGSRKGT